MRESKEVSKEIIAVKDIISRIEKINKFLYEINEDSFSENEILQEAVIRQIAVIGEAAKRISEKTRENNPGFLWKEFAGMRDRLTHQYDRVDIPIVCETSKNELPKYLKYLENVQKRLNKEYKHCSLIESLSTNEKNAFISGHHRTCVGKIDDKEYLMQISEDNKLHYKDCTKIEEQLNNQSVLIPVRLLSDSEIKQLSHGKKLLIENNELYYDVVKSDLVFTPFYSNKKGLGVGKQVSY
jgi:uncharacterized protein with HEPN domain